MRHVITIAALAGALLAGTFSNTAHAQAALQRRLAQAQRLECSFTVVSTADWQGNKPSAEASDATLTVNFFNINIDEGTADMDGGFGQAFVSVRYANGYLHIMLISDAGPLHVTTVLASETAGGRLKAVQTRHEFSPTRVPGFTSRPEMYVGDCAIAANNPA